MQRARRQEKNNGGFKVVGYLGEDGGVVTDVEDRFNTPLMIQIGEGLGWVTGRALAETGIYGLTVADVVTLGFTTDEYKCLLRYAEVTGCKDFIRNEYELTALMAGKVPRMVEELQLAYKDAEPGEVPETMRSLPSRDSGNRTRGNDWESAIYALGWVDETGERVRYVPDRFKAEFAFIGASGQTVIAEPLGETGIRGLPLISIVALGFSKAEYLAILAFETESGECVQSEEELDELVLGPPSVIVRELT